MCTFNGAQYLRQQLESIAAQSRPPDELVICDDGSTDSTHALVADFASSATFPVRFQVNETNLGLTKNFERAIRLCTGDYIALSDQDDVWMPEKLARLETEFLSAPNVGLIFTDAEIVDDDLGPGRVTLWQKLPIGPAELKKLRTQQAIDVLMEGSIVTGATMAFRTRFRGLVLPIPTDLLIIHDAWIAVLVAAVADVLPLAIPLIRYRQHSGQQIGAKERRTIEPSFRSAFRRETSYEDIIQIAEQVQQRLLGYRSCYQSEDALGRIGARLNHLRMRSMLPERVIPRVRSVVSELLAGRYHDYSRGMRSAAKDLLSS